MVDLYEKVTDVCGSIYTNCSTCDDAPCGFHYKEPRRELPAATVAAAIRKLLQLPEPELRARSLNKI